MQKKKYRKGKRFFKFLKEYAAVITIILSIIAVIANGFIKYYNYINSTNFYFQYLSVKIDNSDYIKNYQEKNYGGTYNDYLLAPTYNNAINQLLYKYPKKVTNYYLTYLIIRQTGQVEAQDVKLYFKEYGTTSDISKKKLEDFPIDKQKYKKITKTIKYPFSKNEQLKIPISICSSQNDFISNFDKCYYLEWKPVAIEYKNKYLFSHKNVPIRDYIEHNVIIDGELVTGKGSA